jgi:YfiH family protein
MRPGFPAAVLSHQIHGAKVGTHELPAIHGLIHMDGLDGHVTKSSGLLLTVTVADCVPVYLAHPGSGAVALLHAGWRGVAAGIVEEGIRQLSGLTLAPSADIVMHCGIAICGECYEVGPEVVAAVSDTKAIGKTRLDLRAEIVGRAAAVGVRAATVSEYCAAHDSDRFFSHRRSGGTDGRMIAYLGRASA